MTPESMRQRISAHASILAQDAGRLVVEAAREAAGDDNALRGVIASMRDSITQVERVLNVYRSTEGRG